MITATLNRIRAHSPCGLSPKAKPLTGYQKLKAGLGPDHGPDDPIPFATIVRINELDDALWCCRVEPQHARVWCLFAVWCYRRAQPLIADPRSIAAIDVVERHADGLATDEELAAAMDVVWAAAWDAEWEAAWDAERAAQTAEFLRIVGDEP